MLPLESTLTELTSVLCRQCENRKRVAVCQMSVHAEQCKVQALLAKQVRLLHFLKSLSSASSAKNLVLELNICLKVSEYDTRNYIILKISFETFPCYLLQTFEKEKRLKPTFNTQHFS